MKKKPEPWKQSNIQISRGRLCYLLLLLVERMASAMDDREKLRESRENNKSGVVNKAIYDIDCC
jgi:hypothetical protein